MCRFCSMVITLCTFNITYSTFFSCTKSFVISMFLTCIVCGVCFKRIFTSMCHFTFVQFFHYCWLVFCCFLNFKFVCSFFFLFVFFFVRFFRVSLCISDQL